MATEVRAERTGPNMASLAVPAVFFLLFNFVGGVFYTYLKFDVLGHSDGTGVVPGPWLVVPFLSLAVFPATIALGFVAWLAWRASGRSSELMPMMLLAFVACSVLFHLYIIQTIVLDPAYYS